MNSRSLLATCLIGVLILVLAIALVLPRPIEACAPAPKTGERVEVLDESAVIVWDQASRTQHFIRRATFETLSPDFGFLVPTPSTPALAEASDEAFTRLTHLMKPEVRTESLRGFDFTPLLFFTFALKSRPGDLAVGGVRILDAQRVGGYDAVVLEADDARALTGWLKKHDYAAQPELTDWLAPYLKARWKITAFKIAKEHQQGPVASSAVRMSFVADQPFFPYREPAYQRDPSLPHEQRLLRVFMLSSERMEGELKDSQNSVSGKWPGQTLWTDQLPESLRPDLAKELALSASQLPSRMWLTVFEDPSTPRAGAADLFFRPAETQARITPPPIINTRDERIPLPLDLLLFAVIPILGFFWLVWRIRKNRVLPSP